MERITIKLGSVDMPLFENIMNYSFNSFEYVSTLIDKLDSKNREWGKVPILINDYFYINFLKSLCGKSEYCIIKYLNDFYSDNQFKLKFKDNIIELEEQYADIAGDMRFNSLSLYVIVRAYKPELMIETGVASGKSSALILLAMKHNGKGRLVSIDKPNVDGEILLDGAKTTTKERQCGWMVPSYLRSRWQLIIGDSLIELPLLLGKTDSKIDIFFHDSLHTYEHVKNELSSIWPHMNNKDGLILVDDIDTGAGIAFNNFLSKKNIYGLAYRELGGVHIE
jgi:hypothetical protein